MSNSDRHFLPITNPYIVGNPVEDKKMFFGRGIDFDYIRTKFSAEDQGGMIVICGTRRSGKTSILFQIKQGRLGDRFLPVLVDMQAVAPEDDREFVHMLAGKIREAAGEQAPDVRFDPVGEGFASLREAFLIFCRDLGRALNGVSVVVMFDEYEIFENLIDEGKLGVRVLDLLGEAIRGREGLFLLFAGSDKLEERKADYWSSSLGRALFRRISFLHESDARELIHEPVAGEVTYEDGVPERILDLGARQPFYMQAVCQNLIDRLNDRESRSAALSDVESVAQEIIDNPLPHMIFTWGAMSDPDKAVIACLGELSREERGPRTAADIQDFLKREKTGVTMTEDVLKESLERLFQGDILTKEEDGERFDFRMDLWRLWIGRMHSIWQAMDEIFAKGRKADPAVIRLARRRWKRIGWGALAATVAGALFFAYTIITQPAPVTNVAPPDSSFVRVVTEPAGARVFLDDHELGLSPLDSVRVPAGQFEYRCELEGYHTVIGSVTLATEELGGIEEMLIEETGMLAIDTAPPGATVKLDGVVQEGVTPLTLSGLSARRLYQVRVTLGEFLPRTFENVQIFADSTVIVPHTFSRRSHPLTIATVPSGAVIRFDEREIGRSPRTLATVAQGPHRIAAELAGYFAQDVAVEVPAPGNRVELTLVEHPPGRLVLTCDPYADFYVDGRRVAGSEVSHTMELKEGDHTVEFRHPHFGSKSYDVTITPDETVTVDHDFGGRP